MKIAMRAPLGRKTVLASVLVAGLAGIASPAWAQSDPGLAPPATGGSAPPAASTPAPASSAPSTITAPSDAGGGGGYTVRLHDLERRVNELKEQIFRSKARLNLLKETVLHNVIAGARALIVHRNEMGSSYSLVRLVYALDGAEIYSKIDESGHLGDAREFEVFSGSIVPGNHTLSVLMVYQGNGYGVFSYLKGYKFNVRASHTFTAAEGKQTQLKVVGFEQGNPITTDPKDRPAIDFRMNIVTDKPPAGAQPVSDTGATGAPTAKASDQK
jgi:hypothetical protein